MKNYSERTDTMAIITNNGAINFIRNGEEVTIVSNTVETDVNVTYLATFTKTAADESFSSGGNVIYQLRISNNGTGTLFNPVVSDNLGGVNTPLTIDETSVSGFLYSENGVATPVEVTLTQTEEGATFAVSGTIPEGYFVVITYSADVDAALSPTVTTITNTSTFTANEGTETGEVLTLTDSATVTRESVTIEKAATPDTVNPGDTLTYTFTLTNADDEEVEINSLTDNLPDNFVIDNIITANIGGTSVFYAIGTDFTVSESNLLTINPATTSTPLTIPAATAGASGVTTITITGTVTA